MLQVPLLHVHVAIVTSAWVRMAWSVRGTYASWAAELPNSAGNYAVAAAVSELLVLTSLYFYMKHGLHLPTQISGTSATLPCRAQKQERASVKMSTEDVQDRGQAA